MPAEHKPTKKLRRLVQILAAIGTPQSVIADVLEIDDKTLRLRYPTELVQSKAKCIGAVAATLYQKAIGNGPQSVAAAIFYLKTQGKWRETPTVVEHQGKVAVTLDDQLVDLPEDDLRALCGITERIATRAADASMRPEVAAALDES